jgi:hypothetical protein
VTDCHVLSPSDNARSLPFNDRARNWPLFRLGRRKVEVVAVVCAVGRAPRRGVTYRTVHRGTAWGGVTVRMSYVNIRTVSRSMVVHGLSPK